MERLDQRFLDGTVSFSAHLGEPLFDLHVQSVLGEVCSLASIGTVAVTDPKHMRSLSLLQVRSQDESVLVYFFGVAAFEADSSREGKLLDHVFLFDVRQMGCVRRGRPLHRPFKAQVDFHNRCGIWVLAG